MLLLLLQEQNTNSFFFRHPGCSAFCLHHSHRAPGGGVVGRGMGSKLFGGAAPGFEPRTSCLRVMSVSITLRGPQKLFFMFQFSLLLLILLFHLLLLLLFLFHVQHRRCCIFIRSKLFLLFLSTCCCCCRPFFLFVYTAYSVFALKNELGKL